jgi:hypothetical protein
MFADHNSEPDTEVLRPLKGEDMSKWHSFGRYIAQVSPQTGNCYIIHCCSYWWKFNYLCLISSLIYFRKIIQVSIVSQEPVLFNCSIEENIAYGLDGTASEADIENIAVCKSF